MSSLYAHAEPVIVALIVALSAVAVLRKQAPVLWRRISGQRGRASACGTSDTASSACGSGCGGCGGNDGAPAKPISLLRR